MVRSCLLRSSLLFSATTGLAFVAACGGTSSSLTGSRDASTDGSISGNDGDANANDGSMSGDDGDANGSVDDGSESADAEQMVTEGGSNPDLDASDESTSTAPDGGPCNAITNAAVAVTSACSSEEPILGGGDLVAGTYYLKAVTAYATAAFCKSTFVPVSIRETVEMTVSASGVGTVQTVSQLANAAERRSSLSLTPGANDSSPLTEATTCPSGAASAQVKYEARTIAAATVVILRLPYAKDEADYRFEKQ